MKKKGNLDSEIKKKYIEDCQKVEYDYDDGYDLNLLISYLRMDLN